MVWTGDGPGGYWMSDDKALLDTERVHGWLSGESYGPLAGRRKQTFLSGVPLRVEVAFLVEARREPAKTTWLPCSASLKCLLCPSYGTAYYSAEVNHFRTTTER
jgi:hypothetical protein